MDALWREGVRTLNPALLREAANLTWHDASASDFATGYGGRTVRVLQARSIQALDPGSLAVGDLAVVSNVHILQYLGDGRWIQADPGVWRVVVLAMTDDDLWLRKPAVIVRWRLLAGDGVE